VEWPGTGRPSYLVSEWGFRDDGSNGAISCSNKSNMAAAAILEKFQMAISPQPVVRSTLCLILGGVIGDGGSNGAISGWNKSKMVAAATCKTFKWSYLCNRSPDPLHIWFQGGVFGMADLMVLFPVGTNQRWRPLSSWRNFKGPYLRNG